MSKKILFMSSAKLTALSFGLLLAVFCTIGMSFRPVYDEQEAEEIVMSGPRRAHWDNSSTNSCTGAVTHKYNSTVDKANTNVQTRGNGYVTISTSETANVTAPSSGNPRTVTSSAATSGSTATISWNSGLATETNASTPTYSSEQITVAHKKTFTISATPISDDYYFAGWGTTTSESSIDNYDNPREIVSDMKITGYTSGSKGNPDYSSTAYSETYYAFFKLRVPANITLKVPTNGTITYSYESYPATTLTSEKVVTTKYDVALVAIPDAGYVFFGWYTMEGLTENFISTSENYTRAYPDDITIYAKFIPSNQAIFNVKGTEQYYYDLGRACSEAASSSSKIVYPIADGTVPAGNYTIPSGVTLLVPYSSDNTVQTTPKVVTTEAALSIYRKLILKNGVNINCYGTICVGGQAMAGSAAPTGYVTGACGMIDMSSGGHIEINSGATLYAWGFIKGQDMDQGNNTVGVGTITANSGATIWEAFATGDWRGGTATGTISRTKFFPFQSYYIQNIEVPVTYKFGSTNSNYFVLNATGGPYDTKFTLIGNTNSLFKLTDSGAQVRKWYDPTTDLMCYELKGTALLDELKINISALFLTIDVSSGDFNLPINSNMHIILTDCDMTLNKPLVMQPGAKIEIKPDAKVTIATNVFLYDKDDWGPWVKAKYFRNYGNAYGILTSHKNRGDGSSNELLDDAQLIVDGQLTISNSGKLYSSAGGADIMGNGGGKVIFPSSLPESTTIPWYRNTETSGDGEVGTTTMEAANLCNEDGSYTKAIASKTFLNINGRWFNQTDGASTINADHTYNFTYMASGNSGDNVTTPALYGEDKTGLVAGMKWCNVVQDATCNVEDATHSVIYNATQDLNGTAAANIRYTYQASDWLQLLKTETEGVYGGSDNSLYALDGCTISSLGSVDENCLYTIDGVKKALVDGHFVALEKNSNDEAFHNTANTEEYYISFAGCTWHPATKYAGEEKAYIVEDGNYIWYNNDWLLVEREDPFFFDYNDQNVKRYYEYEDGAWVLASPRVRVVDAIETRDFYFINEAFTVANGKKNTTITLLKDIPMVATSLTYSAKNTTCTLDLNGHTMRGAVPYTDKNNIGGLIVINASGSTFTITDNSDEKNGRIENIKAQNQVTYGVLVTAGTLNVDTGTVYVENPAQYASKAATVNEVAVTKLDACGARAVQVAAGQTFNFKKGLLEAHATRNAYGIVATGNTANTTKVTITGGRVYAEAPCGAYGISCTGKLDMSAGLVEAKLNDHLVDASYTATDASNNLNKHQSCYGIIMNGYANATASSCYFGTLTVTGGKIKASSDLVRSYTSNVYGIYMNVSVAGMGNRNNASTSKTNSEQACSKGSIKNATIEVQNNGNYGYGIIVLGKYNSKDKSNTTIQVENTNVTVKANNYAYGIYASGTINGTTGECSSSDVELTNCTVWAEAEKAAGAYATWVWAGYTTIYQDKQANYYGEYAAGAKMTINSGTYTAKTKTTSAYATGTSLRAKSIYDPTSSTTWGPGEGKEAKATLIIKGGTFLGEATTTTARAVSNGGDCTITGGNFTAIAGTTTAYGLYCQSGKLTATGVPITVYAKGRASSSDNNAYAYGAMADVSIIGSGNQAWTGYACAGEIELNNCTINDTATAYANARGVMVNASSVMLTRANFDKQKTTSSWSTATYNQYNSVFPVQVQGKDSIWVGIAAKATINGGTINVTAHTTTAYGAFVNRALKYSYTKPNTILDEYQGQLEINNATFVVKTETSTTAEGVRAYGPTTITGGSFTVQPSGATAYGLKVYAGKTTVNGNPTFNVKATTTAYGIMAGGGEAPQTKLGYGYDGEVEVNGGTFNVETTSDKPAYGLYVYAGSTPITSTASGYYAGNYASAGKAVINNGEFNVKSKKTEAYGIYMSPAVSQSGATGYETATATPICEVNGGTFTAEGTTDIAYGAFVSNGATLTVTDGTIKGKLTAVAAGKFAVGAYIAAGGGLNATGGTFKAEAAKSGLSAKQQSYACGLYSPDGTATISASNTTFKGELKSNYLSNGDASTWSGGAYGFYARTTNPLSLENCTIIGNSAYQGGFGLRFANTPAEVRNCNITVTTTKAYNYGLFVGGADCDVKLYDCSFNCTSGTTYAYGIYAYNGATYAEDCEINAIVQRTGATSAADSYLYGVLVAAGKTATLKDCSITATGSGKYSNNGYGIYVDGTANLDNCDVAVSNINSNAYALFNTANTTLLNVISGKYKATATSGAASTNGTAAAAKQTLNGGYYSHNTNLSKYAVSPKKVLTLRESHTLYPDYKYTINEGGTVTWKNGDETLKTEMYESGETPEYTGATPTKTADAQYTYTHNGWSPDIAAMENSDVTYTATFSKVENKYTVFVAAGANGAVSPASVSGIGCETASADITATPEAGYRFVNWTLPEGVTAADGYTVASNPIRIHAVATDKTITANFAARTDINYTVKHYQQNIADDDYTEVTADQETLQGTTATATAATAKSYTGFTAQPIAQETIAGDGTTIVNIYYNRKTYTITWVDGDENTIKTDEEVKYGATPSYTGETPTKSNSETQSFVFNNTWSPAVTAVTDNAIYTAQFKAYDLDLHVTEQEQKTINEDVTITTTTVENGGTLTVGNENNGVTLQSNTIIVESGGQLDVADNGSIAADVFIIEATTEDQEVRPGAHEEVQVSGELSETGSKNVKSIYYDLTRKGGTEPFLARVWYAVAVPWAVEVPNYTNGGVFIKRGENYVPQRLGATFDLISYDGNCRAQNGASANCWKYLEDEIVEEGEQRIMVPGKLYMIYLTEETYTIRFKKKDGVGIHTNTLTVSPYVETTSNEGKDANWNGIANPATYKAYMNVSVKGLVQKFIPGTQPRDGGRYLTTTLDDKQAVGQPFFVQVDPSAGTSVVVTRTDPSAAPLRAQAEATDTRYAIGIAANGKLADRIYIQTAEEKEDKYVIGQDMSKMGISNYVAQMWVARYDSKLCLNTMALTRDKANYPLGISVPRAGEYMIFAPTDIASGDDIYLTLDNRVIWNLTMSPYYASLEQGTTTRYGLRLVRNTPAVQTGVDETQSVKAQCMKVIMDDHVYILRGEELYTITGQKAK